ncbi:polyphenol oxidase I, chloroplastic-like [Olea europaea subsp. europaea]|uniref:Polyphenol oxidase I, chloroplastic-like n=1 Tax=Olea europaea subsp. europaea TaxID=158383 RepID=A0A8S0UK52_OLEEU|nr:polyphenol oxidase I, chloroplastic-like [Olea europaea subsp. europaea]
MASLSPPCTLFTTAAAAQTAVSSNSSPQPRFAKPSYFFTHAKTSPSFRVSCNARNGEQNMKNDSEGKVDRRNMLFGLGGLYGAANLASNQLATAEPIKPPELDKCGTATNLNTGEKLDINCCPPTTQRIIDYRLPPVRYMRTRPSAHRVTPEYIFKYNMAIDRMKRLPADDPRNFMQQANIHCAYCNGAYDQPGQGTLDLQVHNSWLFFPFHRWYLYFYERILGKLIGDPTFALPFWNWDNPKGMTMPPMFVDPKSALYDEKRNQSNLPPAVIDLGMTGNTDTLQVVTNNLTIMYTEMIRGNQTAEDFMGNPYREGTEPNPGPGASERGSHTAAHVWVGDPRQPSSENLGNFYSAGRDPLFYCHHANVDRMWTLWQYFLPSNKVPDKKITDPDFLNAAFLFYDENKQLVRVTVKDCLDNLRMGFDYERIDLPWLDYRPPPQTARARVIKTTSDAPLASTIFPVTLDKIIRVQVPKAKKGKADELLVLENIEVDTTKFLKVDVFVNDEDDNINELDKASYAGTYAQVPHKTNKKANKTSIRLKLTDLYDDMDIEDDDTVLVTLVPRHQGGGITIGGIKIIEAPATKSS